MRLGTPLLLFSAALCTLVLGSPARGALDAEQAVPYQVQVVLHVARHRQLTFYFREQVRRELRDGLQAALGDLGRVEVVEEHPLLAQVATQGLRAALEGWKAVSPRKTHFVLIDFVNGQYEIQTCQHDGLTTQVSPLRRERTADRQFVARTAALLIDRDFGVVGTLDPAAKGSDVRVLLKGGKLGVPLSRWVRKGDVFAVVQVIPGRGEPRAERLAWVLLQAADPPGEDGTLSCRLYHRYKDPLAAGGALGLRCIKLGTTTGPLRLRLVDDKTFRPLADQAVNISRLGFDGKVTEGLSTDSEGLVVSREAYTNMAFVQVLSGSIVRARIPAEILEDHTVICPLSANPQAELLGQLDLHRRQWRGRVYESTAVADELFKELNRLVKGKSHKEAVEKAKAGLEDLGKDLAARQKEMDDLRAALKELPPEQRPDLKDGEQRLRDLEARRGDLKGFIERIENVLSQTENSNRKDLLGMLEQAGLHEGEAEFSQALALYKQVKDKAEGEPVIRKHAEDRLKELEPAWEIKSDAHKQARAFIYDTWPKLDTAAKLKERLADARKAFETCREVKDTLTPRMLLKSNVAHFATLKKQYDALQLKDSEDDRRQAQDISDVSGGLQKLTEDLSSFLVPKADAK